MVDAAHSGETRGRGVVGLLSAALEWRCIGPHRGGRVVAVAGDPSDPNVFYFGACAGGVWKTIDGGTYWENVSDGFFNTAAVGAIAVADSDPNVIYVGTGESCIRIDVSHGDGVYKSTDGGRTWTNVGLDDTRHIARIRVHPEDPDLVYVAALGHAFGPNQQRGVFRSTNGGETWDQVLFKSEKAGAIDLSMDARNPRVLYASIWEARRTFWEISSGGPDSGLYKSTDGGDTWAELTGNPGMPQGIKGRIGVAASPAKSGRVWALIEAAEGGLFRSDDGGETWERVSDSDDIRGRPWYYTHIFADPQDADTVWDLCYNVWKSTDGGRTFAQVTTPHGDNHDLWIDPRNTQRMIEGNDGGACVSYNGGVSWSSIYNQPTSEFYHVAVDNHYPYRVHGTQQDSSAIRVPSRSYKGAILIADCDPVGFSESGDIAVKPDDPEISYSVYPGGTVNRFDARTGQERIVSVWPDSVGFSPPRDDKYRFNWKFPVVFSPHDPNVLYVAGNVAFRTADDGTTWEAISPDLTRNDPTKQDVSGGPITLEGGSDVSCTIYSFVESPQESGLLWAGTDDGLVHVSRNGGETWEDVTPQDLPEWTRVSVIEASPHDAATAYLAGARYKLDDNRPFLFKTSDYGKTWTKITDGIPNHDFTRVIREDPARRGLLYAGTETGVYVSLDDGASWQSLQCAPSAGLGQGLPVVPIYDLTVKDNDLVAATHGRSFWILDDLTPLHQITAEILEAPAHLLKPRPTHRFLNDSRSAFRGFPGKNYELQTGTPVTRYQKGTGDGDTSLVYLDAGKNPPDGVVVTYYLEREPEDDVRLTFSDSNGDQIKVFSSNDRKLEPRAGFNRFVWDMRYPGPAELSDDEGALKPESQIGPMALPGSYRVELSAEGRTYSETLEIVKDPRISATQQDLEAQFALLIRIRDKVSDIHNAVDRLRGVRRQVQEWERRAEGRTDAAALSEAATGLKASLSAIEKELVPVKPPAGSRRGTPARLNGKVARLTQVVSSADWPPTTQSYAVFEEASARVDAQLLELQRVIDTDLADFVRLVGDLEIPAIVT